MPLLKYTTNKKLKLKFEDFILLPKFYYDNIILSYQIINIY